MAYHLIFHPQAELEYTEAYQWYEAQKEGLGGRFEEQVESRLKQIAMNPEAYSFRGSFREAAIKYFPYIIIYQTSKSNENIYSSNLFENHNGFKSNRNCD